MASHTLLAVPLVSAAPPLRDQLRAARDAGADLVELRVDCIGDVAAVEALLAGPRDLPLILTVRSADEGGAWAGDDAERIALIERLGLRLAAPPAAQRQGDNYIDIEYATWQRSANVRQKLQLVSGGSGQVPPAASRPKNRLIISWHDFAGTPADLDTPFERLAEVPAEVLKAVFTAHDATDALRVLSQLRRRAAARPLIALAMGEAGLVTRVLARKFGAFLTFAALSAERASAPGQPTVAELRGLYRWDRIGSQTRVYGVVGWPVAHSLSPAIQNAALGAADIDAVYVPLPVRPDASAFDAFMEQASASGLDVGGLSVTVPHKEHALRWLTARGGRVSELAARCGAVNTLIRQADGTWAGDNTDARGALAALQAGSGRQLDQLRGARVAVLGAGGVARAVVAALQDHQCSLTIYNRTPGRGAELARELRCASQPWEERVRYAGDLLINCTSVGLWPTVDDSPMPDDALRPDTLIFDTVYRPAQTRLLRAAAARGCRTISGVEMFLAQAAAQFELWHGRPAPVAVTRAAWRAGAQTP